MKKQTRCACTFLREGVRFRTFRRIEGSQIGVPKFDLVETDMPTTGLASSVWRSRVNLAVRRHFTGKLLANHTFRVP